MAFSWPDVSVVIPHYNDAEALERVVAAVRAQDYAGAVSYTHLTLPTNREV